MRGSLGLLLGLSLLQVAPARAESPKSDCGDASGYQADSPWPAYQGCSTRLGQSLSAGAQSADFNWKVDLYANVDSPAIDAAGNVYVGSGIHLHSISPSGVVRWSSFMWADVAAAPAIAADGTIYAVSVAGGLAAIDPVDGSHLWDYFGAWGWAINSSPLIGEDGTIYFADANNFVHAVNPDGTARFVRWFPGPIASSLTMSRNGRSLYIGSTLWGLRSIDAVTGNIEWITNDHMAEYTAPAVGFDGTVYAGSSHGEFYALSPFDGEPKWSVENKSLFGLIDNWGAITSAPAIAPDGTIVFGTDKGFVVGVDRKGNVLWERRLPAGFLTRNTVTAAPAIDRDGFVYVGSANKSLYCIDSVDGSVVWSYATLNGIYSAPAIGAQGTIYVGSNDNNIYSIGIGEPPEEEVVVDRGEVPVGPSGTILPVATDSNGDALEDADGNPILDIDQDGIPDNVDSSIDVDGDGIDDRVDPIVDTDGDGIPDADDDTPGRFRFPHVPYCQALDDFIDSKRGGDPADFASAEHLEAKGWMTPRQNFDTRYNYNASDPSQSTFEILSLPVTSTGPVTNGCEMRLCEYEDPNAPARNQPLTASQQNNLLYSGSGGVSQIDADLYVPCEALDDRDIEDCRFPVYPLTHYAGGDCDTNSDCTSGYTCRHVCPAQVPSAPFGPPQEDCEWDDRVDRCVASPINENCAEAIEDEPVDCHTVQECADPGDLLTEADAEPECANNSCEGLLPDIADYNEPATPPAGEETSIGYSGSEYSRLLNPTHNLSTICKVTENEGTRDKKNDNRTPDSGQGKKWGVTSDAQFDAEFKVKAGPFGLSFPKAHALGKFDVKAIAWGQDFNVFLLKGEATADMNLSNAKLESVGVAKLFGQRIGAVEAGASLADVQLPSGVTLPDGATSSIKALEHFGNELSLVGADAKARLGQVLRIYNRIFSDPDGDITGPERIITRQLCIEVLNETAVPFTGSDAQVILDNDSAGEFAIVDDTLVYADSGDAVLLRPICDAPLTRATARVVLNEIITPYRDAVRKIDQEIDWIMDLGNPGGDSPYAVDDYSPWGLVQLALGNPIATDGPKFELPSSTSQELGSQLKVNVAEQNFTIVAAEASFPIGPIALTVAVDGYGSYGISAGVDYGFKYELLPANPNDPWVSAYANAFVQPEAGVGVDVFVGVGFNFGIGGASVGISGDINLVTIEVPVGGKVELGVYGNGEVPGGYGVPDNVAHLDFSAANRLLERIPRRFSLGMGASVNAGMNFTILGGDLNLALRVRLLFFKKTWKKRIAKLPSIQKSYNWVVALNDEKTNWDVPLTLPAAQLDILPNLEFPSIPDVRNIDFDSLASQLPLGGSVPSSGDRDDLANFLRAQGEYFVDTTWRPGVEESVLPWDDTLDDIFTAVPRAQEAASQVTGALNSWVGNTPTGTLFSRIPSCGLTVSQATVPTI